MYDFNRFMESEVEEVAAEGCREGERAAWGESPCEFEFELGDCWGPRLGDGLGLGLVLELKEAVAVVVEVVVETSVLALWLRDFCSWLKREKVM